MNQHLPSLALLLLVSTLMGACAGCETHPVPPTPGTGGGDSLGGAWNDDSSCEAACANAARMQCPQAEAEGDVTCVDLCHQIPALQNNAACAAHAQSCSDFDACSSGGG